MRALSNDLRKRVIDAVDGGMSRRAAAERFGVAVSTAIRWVGRWQASGILRPDPQGGDKRSYHIEAYAYEILELVENNKDITLAEIATHLEDRYGRLFASSTIWRLAELPRFRGSRIRTGDRCNLPRIRGKGMADKG